MAARIRRIGSYDRRAPIREPYDTVLIVCEGKKTEPNYFNGLKAELRLSSANIEVTNAPGSDPMSIVLHAEHLMGQDNYDRAFCVFDRDGHANFAAAVARIRNCQRGQAGTWQAITSTPCFELWLLLHYQYSTAPIVRAGNNSAGDVAVRSLREVLPGYSKGARNIFDLVGSRTDDAIANGHKLEKYNAASQSNNPETELHILVDYLRKLKRA